MNISIDSPDAAHFVKSYTPGLITLNSGEFDHSLLIYDEQVIAWQPQKINELDANAIAELLALQPNMVILGTGSQQVFPSHDLLAPLYDKHIGLEIMTTEAACRTYNILADEGRDVLAALIIK